MSAAAFAASRALSGIAAPEHSRDRAMVIAAAMVTSFTIGAVTRQLLVTGGLLPTNVNPWLVLHLATVLPALPLGAYVLVRRKGDAPHRLLGRLWAALMIGAALSSFGLHGLNGGFSWIHLLSIVVLIGIPRAIWAAVRGDIAAHRRGMRAVFIGLLAAGLFAFVPGRLFWAWLVG